MTAEELARLQLAELDRWIAHHRGHLDRLEAKRKEFQAWVPGELPRGPDGLLHLHVPKDPWEIGGSPRGTRYEHVFDVAAVAATELNEPVRVTWEEMTFISHPGMDPIHIRRGRGSTIGNFITDGPQ